MLRASCPRLGQRCRRAPPRHHRPSGGRRRRVDSGGLPRWSSAQAGGSGRRSQQTAAPAGDTKYTSIMSTALSIWRSSNFVSRATGPHRACAGADPRDTTPHASDSRARCCAPPAPRAAKCGAATTYRGCHCSARPRCCDTRGPQPRYARVTLRVMRSGVCLSLRHRSQERGGRLELRRRSLHA